MNILRTDVSIINRFLNKFKELLSNKQFETFKMFVYASLKIINVSISPLFLKSCLLIIRLSNISFQTLNGVMKS